MMQISVLMPSYNYRHFIGAAVSSVLSQPGAEVEVNISDGGSSDGTVALLEGLEDPRIDLVSEPDHGQSDALSKSLGRATGKVIGWLNADDYYLPGALHAVSTVFEQNPGVDVVSGDVCFVDEDGRLRRVVAGYPVSDAVLQARGCIVPSCATFVRRSALDGWSFDTGLRVIMDWDYFLHLRRRGTRWAHVRRPLAAFRIHEAQVTAEPIDRMSVEHQRVSERYRLPPRGRQTIAKGDWLHRYQKLRWGSYMVEARAARLRGRVLPADESSPVFAALLRAYGGNLEAVRLS